MKAFPQKYPIDASEPHHWIDNPLDRGMDLRDYFAAKATQGMMEGPLNPSALRAIALVAYQIADQMIEVREL